MDAGARGRRIQANYGDGLLPFIAANFPSHFATTWLRHR
jgi:hypothetical protein